MRERSHVYNVSHTYLSDTLSMIGQSRDKIEEG